MPAFSVLPDFDIEASQNASHFAGILRRVNELGRSIIDGYCPPNQRVGIKACIKATKEFNAATWKSEATVWIGISSATTPLLLILFGALLSDNNVLPELDTPNEDAPVTEGFLFHPTNLSRQLKVQIRLSEEKNQVAEILADLCIAFIYLHELGHVLSGHCGASEHLWGSDEVVEFDFAAPKSKRRSEWLEMRQFWEYQADSIAASLMCQYINLAVNDERNRAWLVKLAGSSDFRNIRLHAAALINMAISALFLFMAGCRLRNGAEKTHPDPIVRSMYVKDMIAGRLGEDLGCHPTEIGSLQFEYLEPFALAMESIGLGSIRDWRPKQLDRMNDQALKLAAATKYLAVTRAWSWLPETEWTGSSI